MSPDLDLVATTLAERLGLPAPRTGGGGGLFHSTSRTISGEVDGAPLTLAVQFIQPHRNEHVLDLQSGTVRPMSSIVELVVEAQLPFRPRLDAGLALQPVASWAALKATAPDGGFERRFALRTSDPERASLVPETARAALDRSFVGSPGPVVNDGGITWTFRSAPPWPELDALAAAIRELPGIWRAIREVARTTPPVAALEDAWAVLAGVELPDWVGLWGCPAGLQGERRGVRVGVVVAPYLSGGGWVTRCRVDLPAVLPGAPRIARESAFGWLDRATALLAGRSEIEVGDDAFDRRFAIRSHKRDELLALLEPDVRKAMLALDGVLPVELDAKGIEARGRLTSDRALRDAVHATLALAGFLGDARPEAEPPPPPGE